MLLDPVRLVDIAQRCGVPRDTAKKWTERYDSFPRPAVGRARGQLWEWRAVEQWLLATGRLPGALRYRTLDGGLSMRVESSELRQDGGVRWTLLATFHGDPDGTGFRVAIPAAHLKETADDPKLAAYRLLTGWDSARVAWVRDHPDEPMPAHLVGSGWPLDPDPDPEEEPPVGPAPAQLDNATLAAERDRLAARLAEIDRLLAQTESEPREAERSSNDEHPA
jgi:hypothetical protein